MVVFVIIHLTERYKMKKTAIVLVVSLMSIMTPATAAERMKSVVIIDTGYDASVSQAKQRIVYEKCITNSVPSCPNGKSNQEGQFAASLTKEQLAVYTADHGTKMLATSVAANPNIPIIFIRTSSITKNSIAYPSDVDLVQALSWSYLNRNRMNIGAVVLSASRNVNSCNPPAILQSTVKALKDSGIPTIIAAGNDYNYKMTGYPACMSDAISVGATDSAGISLFSNYSKDFYATGTLNITLYDKVQQISGTSGAAQIFATNWVSIRQAKPTLTYVELYNLIKNTSKPVSNVYLKNMPLIDIDAALK